METIEAIIEAFGGAAELGRALGRTTEHIASMRRRNSIPVRYWPALLSAAHRRGLQLDAWKLMRMHAPAAAE